MERPDWSCLNLPLSHCLVVSTLFRCCSYHILAKSFSCKAHAVCTLLSVQLVRSASMQLTWQHLRVTHTMQESLCEAFDNQRPSTDTVSLFKPRSQKQENVRQRARLNRGP